MLNAVYGLTCSYTVCVICICDIIELFKLTSLFPSQSMTEIRGGVALCVVLTDLATKTSEKILPLCITVDVCGVSYLSILVGAFCFNSN